MPVNGGELVVRYGNIDYHAYVGGNNTDFPEILNWPVAEGSYFTERDEDAATTVAVIGYKVRKKLFGSANPIGRYILIENVPFQVIGVLAEKGSSSGDKDADNRIAIPYSAASIRLFGTRNPEYVIIAAADAQRVHQAERAIDQLMLRLHRGQRDYELTNNAAMIQAEAKTQNTLSLMLGSIAAISLLVGGIGVMNIMLMTVRERTARSASAWPPAPARRYPAASSSPRRRCSRWSAAWPGSPWPCASAACCCSARSRWPFPCRPSSAPSVARWSPAWCSASCRRARPPSWTRWPPWPANDGYVHEESLPDFRLPAARRLRQHAGAPRQRPGRAQPVALPGGRAQRCQRHPPVVEGLRRAGTGQPAATRAAEQPGPRRGGGPRTPGPGLGGDRRRAVAAGAECDARRQPAELLRDSGYSGTDATSDNDAVDSFSAGLSASYEVDFWGGRRAAYRSALESLKASEYDRATVELTLLSGVANSYLQVLALREQQRIARLNLDNAEHVLRLVETRHAAGSATALEVAQQSSLVASQRKQLPLLEQQAHEALITLATLIGEPVQALQVAERPFDSLRWPETGAGLPSELLSRRPDIANAEAQLAAAQADVQVARAALFPKLTLSASLSSGANRAADTFRNPYYNLGANLLARSSTTAACAPSATAAWRARKNCWKPTARRSSPPLPTPNAR